MSVDSSIDRCQRRYFAYFFPTHFLAHYEPASERERERKIALIVFASEISVDSPRGYIFYISLLLFLLFSHGWS